MPINIQKNSGSLSVDKDQVSFNELMYPIDIINGYVQGTEVERVDRKRLPWSKEFISQLKEKEFRDAYVADRVRSRIAQLIRTLREQAERKWSQAELGKRMGKPQSVISRLEDPDYGKLSLQTLFEVAAAFDLPLSVDIPEWDEWARITHDTSSKNLERKSFNFEDLVVLSESSHAPSPLNVVPGQTEIFDQVIVMITILNKFFRSENESQWSYQKQKNYLQIGQDTEPGMFKIASPINS